MPEHQRRAFQQGREKLQLYDECNSSSLVRYRDNSMIRLLRKEIKRAATEAPAMYFAPGWRGLISTEAVAGSLPLGGVRFIRHVRSYSAREGTC